MTSDITTLVERAPVVEPAEIAELNRRAGIDARRVHLLRSRAPLSRAEREVLAQELDLEATSAIQAARGWLARAIDRDAPGPTILALSGPEGTGRTFAAAWVLGQQSGRYVDVEQLAYSYRLATRKNARVRDRDELRAWRKASVLVVAGIGAERDVETMREALGRIIDARVTPRRTLTVLLTELTPPALLEHAGRSYDARTNERLRTDAVVVDLRGGA